MVETGARRSTRAAALPSLTGLRFIAALAVVAWHARPDHIPGLLQPLFTSAQSGVAFFFLLSGFVLTWSSRRDDTPRSFYWRRVARVVPNHVVTWLVALVLAV